LSRIKLIVGLGNPGPDYTQTRHNVGAWFVDALARQYGETLRAENKFHGLTATIRVDHQKCLLLFPTTYMNDSGIAVGTVTNFYKITPAEILVAHDELDFPAGQIRLKETGGHGGHNGLRDIINHLHNKDFWRLRIGIGHPGHKDKVTPFVLGRPASQDQTRIETAIDDGLAVVDDIITGNTEKAMRYLHQ